MVEKFGFIAHTFEIANLKETAPLIYKKDQDKIEQCLKSIPPSELCKVTNLRSIEGVEVEGVIATTWLLPKQYLFLSQNEVYKKILDAVRICAKAGAKIVGLGGYNSIVPTGSGLRVSRDSRIGVTNGNTYTIVTSLEAVKTALLRAGVSMDSVTVAIIGATGSIGSVLSELFAIEKPAELILVARNEARLKGRAQTIQKNTGHQCSINTDIIDSLKKAQVIVCATSTPESLITPEHLLPGTIICDTAVPHNVSDNVAHTREDVIVFEGGLAIVPQGKYQMRPDYTDSFELHNGMFYACFCETAMLAMEGMFDHFSLYGISVEMARQIWQIANKHGFKLAPLRNKKYGPISDNQFEAVGQILRKRL